LTKCRGSFWLLFLSTKRGHTPQLCTASLHTSICSNPQISCHKYVGEMIRCTEREATYLMPLTGSCSAPIETRSAVSVRTQICWDIIPCMLGNSYRCFFLCKQSKKRLLLTWLSLKMKTLRSCSSRCYWSAQRNVTQLINILERSILVREFISSNLFCSYALKIRSLIITASQSLCEAYTHISISRGLLPNISSLIRFTLNVILPIYFKYDE